MSDSITSVNPFRRGGMDPNPFGGEDRIDRINLMEFLEANAPSEKVLYARVIQDAASNYLYAFLGKNGTSAEEFFAAHQYFFKVVSTDMATWNHHRTIKQSFTRRGKKVTEDRYLTDSELQLMCFDKHYEFSGLSKYMHIDKFKNGLKARRTKILKNNWEQVTSYINVLYQHELSMIAEGHQVPLQVWHDNLLSVLVDPPTPLHLASSIFVPNKLKRPRRSRAKKTIGTSPNAALATRLEKNNLPALGQDWGPLSTLGVNDAEVVCHDSSGSIPSHTD